MEAQHFFFHLGVLSFALCESSRSKGNRTVHLGALAKELRQAYSCLHLHSLLQLFLDRSEWVLEQKSTSLWFWRQHWSEVAPTSMLCPSLGVLWLAEELKTDSEGSDLGSWPYQENGATWQRLWDQAFRGLPQFSLGLLSCPKKSISCWWNCTFFFLFLAWWICSILSWYILQVLFMNFFVFTEHQNVTEETHSVLLSCNDLFHGALENLWCRPNAPWQSAVEVSAKWTDKCSEFGRFIIQWNLPKSTPGIQLGKDGRSLQFVKDVFNCQ